MTTASLVGTPDRLVSFRDLAGEQAIAVVAPHPDDETLGCGGLIALAVSRGVPVVVIVLTDGSGSHPHSAATPPSAVVALRSRELAAATAALGLKPNDVIELGLPDGRLAQADRAAAARRVAGIVLDRGARHVFVTGAEDTHPDHRAAFDLVKDACRATGAVLWTYPVRAHIVDAVSRDAQVVKLDIGAVLPRKRAAIACHPSQTGGVVTDDPGGFRLTTEDLDRHGWPYEIFIRETPAILNDPTAGR